MLTDFQNYFTTEKGIKFPTNHAIFHYILNMFPQFIRIGLFSRTNICGSFFMVHGVQLGLHKSRHSGDSGSMKKERTTSIQHMPSYLLPTVRRETRPLP